MTRYCVLLAGMMALCVFPPDISAQGVPGRGGTPGPAGIPCVWPSSVSGTNICQGHSAFSMPKLYFGWLEHSQGSTWVLERQNQSGTAQWPVRGLWVGATKEVAVNDGLDVLLSGSVFVPKRSAATWYTTPASRTFDFEIPSYDWWTVDGLAKSRF